MPPFGEWRQGAAEGFELAVGACCKLCEDGFLAFGEEFVVHELILSAVSVLGSTQKASVCSIRRPRVASCSSSSSALSLSLSGLGSESLR